MRFGNIHQYIATSPVRTSADGRVARVLHRLERTDLHARVAVRSRCDTGVIEHAGQARMHRVDVIAAVEVVIDEHLPVAVQLVFAAVDEAQRLDAAAARCARATAARNSVNGSAVR